MSLKKVLPFISAGLLVLAYLLWQAAIEKVGSVDRPFAPKSIDVTKNDTIEIDFTTNRDFDYEVGIVFDRESPMSINNVHEYLIFDRTFNNIPPTTGSKPLDLEVFLYREGELISKTISNPNHKSVIAHSWIGRILLEFEGEKGVDYSFLVKILQPVEELGRLHPRITIRSPGIGYDHLYVEVSKTLGILSLLTGACGIICLVVFIGVVLSSLLRFQTNQQHSPQADKAEQVDGGSRDDHQD